MARLVQVSQHRSMRGLRQAAGARRHRFTGIRDTPNRRAISQLLTPASISSAAASGARGQVSQGSLARPPTSPSPQCGQMLSR
jgi:hypothetical protein